MTVESVYLWVQRRDHLAIIQTGVPSYGSGSRTTPAGATRPYQHRRALKLVDCTRLIMRSWYPVHSFLGPCLGVHGQLTAVSSSGPLLGTERDTTDGEAERHIQ